MGEFVVIARPPADEPQTFERSYVNAAGEEVPITGDRMQHITVNTPDEEAARRLVTKQFEAIARQELQEADAAAVEQGGTSKYEEDPDALENDIPAKMWVIESITPFDSSVGSDSYPADHPSAAREDVPEPVASEQNVQTEEASHQI